MANIYSSVKFSFFKFFLTAQGRIAQGVPILAEIRASSKVVRQQNNNELEQRTRWNENFEKRVNEVGEKKFFKVQVEVVESIRSRCLISQKGLYTRTIPRHDCSCYFYGARRNPPHISVNTARIVHRQAQMKRSAK